MKTIIKTTTLAVSLTLTILHAGKNVVPAEVPVVPVINPIPLYVGVGLLWSGSSVDCPCDGSRLEETTYGGILRLGYDFNQYIGVEARVLKGIWDKDFMETTHYGLYLKPQYHISDDINVYGLIGYGNTKVECDVRGVIHDDTGVSFGAGLEYDLSLDSNDGSNNRIFDGQGDQEKGLGLWVDYQNLLQDEGNLKIKANILSAGVTYDF